MIGECDATPVAGPFELVDRMADGLGITLEACDPLP